MKSAATQINILGRQWLRHAAIIETSSSSSHNVADAAIIFHAVARRRCGATETSSRRAFVYATWLRSMDAGAERWLSRGYAATPRSHVTSLRIQSSVFWRLAVYPRLPHAQLLTKTERLLVSGCRLEIT